MTTRPNPFTLKCKCSDTRGRTGILDLGRASMETPVFMPVGTRATVKTLSSEDVKALGFNLILGNTFHLLLRPGHERVQKLGGLHKFMQWPGAILTDSGGYQVFSLSGLRKISEEGALFASPIDGRRINLTPELSAEVQRDLGSDIVMAFDECIPYPSEPEYIASATARSARWTARCLQHLRKIGSEQFFFGIVQGGLDPKLRAESADSMKDLDCDGYAIGGLSVGEPQELMLQGLEMTTPHLPDDRPRYLMGVGMPEDIVAGVARGVDMFDCVLPTRMGRHATLFVRGGRLRIKNARFAEDESPIEAGCPCPACVGGYSRAYLHHLFRCGEFLGPRLASMHNLAYYAGLMDRIRDAIRKGIFGEMVKSWALEGAAAEGEAVKDL